MPSAATIIHIEGRAKPWRVTWREAGKRRTAHYRSKGEAHARARAVRVEVAAPELAVSVEERMLIAQMRKAAAAAGVSMDALSQAVIELARAHTAESVPLPEAARAWLREGESRNLRPKTLEQRRWVLDRFADALPGQVVENRGKTWKKTSKFS